MPVADNAHIAYLCLQATIEGQASHAHVHEIIKGLRTLGYTVDLFEPAYAQTHKQPGPIGRVLEFRRLHRRLAAKLSSYDALYVRKHPYAKTSANRARELGIPIKYVGLGEQADDLQPFDAKQFAEALFTEKEHE